MKHKNDTDHTLFSHHQPAVTHQVQSHSMQETKKIALQWLQTYTWTKSIVLLYGEIGAGKSTFVRSCLENLHLINSQYRFSSPSFSLVNEYPISHTSTINEHTSAKVPLLNTLPNTIQNVQHVDLYRLHDKNELYDIDIFADENSLYFVEWPNKVSYDFFIQLQIPISAIYFTILDETVRSIAFTHFLHNIT